MKLHAQKLKTFQKSGKIFRLFRERNIKTEKFRFPMQTSTVQKHKKLSDSEQTIAEIRALRWELSKEIKSYEDVKKIEKNV